MLLEKLNDHVKTAKGVWYVKNKLNVAGSLKK